MNVAAAAFVLFLPAIAPPPGTMTAQEFLAARGRWPGWERSGETLRIEGRVRGVVRDTLRLENVPLVVRPAAGATLGRADNRTDRVRVVGRIAPGPTGPFLQANAVDVLPSDDAVFTERKAALDKSDPAAWEGLAAWAEDLAAFYGDESLLRRAALARRSAFDLRWDAAGETQTLPEGAPVGVPPGLWAQLALLDATPATAETGLDADFKRVREHDALRDWWRAARDDAKSDLTALSGTLVARLPGADRPPGDLPPETEKLFAAYAKDPEGTYRDADGEARRRLHRRFFAAVERERIERDAAPDGRDGFAVAARLDARLPELPALAERYRDRELAWRRGRVASATRGEAVELAELLRARGKPEQAAEVLGRWLAAREASLRADGLGGLIRAAEEYRAVADDTDAAVRLLKEAYVGAAPGSPEEAAVAAKLKDLGLTRRGDRWLTAAELAAEPVDPIAAAVRSGVVTVGMTAAQVRASQGAPQAKTRAAGALNVSEVWVYGAPAAAFGGGGSGLVVHLSRPRSGSAADAVVVAVDTL